MADIGVPLDISNVQIPLEFNFLILGKAGVGKSTVANCLLGNDSNLFRTHQGFNHGTIKIETKSYTFDRGNKKILVNIVDCVGFFIDKNQDFSTLNRLKYIIRKDLRLKINKILLCVPYGRFTNEIYESIIMIKNLLFATDLKTISWIIFTHCDEVNVFNPDKIINEFKNDNRTMEIQNVISGYSCCGKKNTIGLPEPIKVFYDNIANEYALSFRNKLYDDPSFLEFTQTICDKFDKSEK